MRSALAVTWWVGCSVACAINDLLMGFLTKEIIFYLNDYEFWIITDKTSAHNIIYQSGMELILSSGVNVG